MTESISVTALQINPYGSVNSPEEEMRVTTSSIQSFTHFHSTTDLVSCSKKSNKGWRQYKGIILTLIASLCISTSVLFVKILKDYGLDAYGASFLRYIGVTIPIIGVVWYIECGPRVTVTESDPRKSVFESVWPLSVNGNWKTFSVLLINGLLGSTGWIFRCYALQYLTIGDTSVITYATPILVTVMGHFLLGEKCGVIPIVVAFTTLGGLVIVSRPPLLTGGDSFDSQTLIGTSLAVGSLLCSSFCVIIIRRFREVHYALLTLVSGLIGLVQAILLSVTVGQFNLPQGWFDLVLSTAVAVLSFGGVMLIVLAVKVELAGTVSLVRSSEVVFGFVLQFVCLGVVPDLCSFIGAAIVMGGVVVIAYRKYLGSLSEGEAAGHRFTWLLR